MSLFSYIAFPRQVDISCLKSKFDKTKVFTIAEIRGAEVGTQIKSDLSELPDGLHVYLGDLLNDAQGTQIYENREASFDAVFTNQFVYSFQATFELLDAERYLEECISYFNDDVIDNGDMRESDYIDFAHSMIKYNRDTVAVCRKQLHELIQINTHLNEFIEIYSEYVDHINFNLGPPKGITTLHLSQVLTSELLRNEDNLKIEIHHIV